MFDFIVVGAGPAGSSAAAVLSSSGAKTLVIDRKNSIGSPVECGEGLSADEIKGIGLSNRDYISGSAEGVELIMPTGSIFVKKRMFSIDREIFDRHLAEDAASNGALFHTGETAVSLSRSAGYWAVRTSRGMEYRARYIIGADGHSSIVGSSIGAYLRRDVITGTSVRGTMKDIPDMFQFFFSSDFPHGYGYIFPRENSMVNAGVVLKGVPVVQSETRFLESQGVSVLSKRGGGIPFLFKMKAYYGWRSFLAGDAAGMANSITYGGIYPAVISGRLAASSALCALDSDRETCPDYDRKITKSGIVQKNPEKEHNMIYSMSEEDLSLLGRIGAGKYMQDISLSKSLSMMIREGNIGKIVRFFRLYMYFRSF